MNKIMPAIIAVLMAFAFNQAQALGPIENQQEQNKENVIAFYNAAINQKDFDVAIQYLGQAYVQHNPTAADGIEGLQGFIQFLRNNYPNSYSEIKKVFAEGDYVFLHVHSVREPGTRGRAIFDLFKLDHGKIIEHWDTVQDIPAESANSNGMF